MKRVLFAFAGTVTGLVLLLSFKTQPSTTAAATPPAAVSGSGGTTATATSGSGTVTGDAADTRFGPVQVRITVENGKLTSATAVEYPTENPRDQEINEYAIPTLNQEAAQAGNADIDLVSGATYTSDGYAQSLQSALDKAGLS